MKIYGRTIEILMVGILLALQGCATDQTKSGVPNSATLDKKLQEKAKIYKKEIRSVVENDLKPGQCTKLFAKLHTNWNWRDAVTTGDNCLRTHELSRVEEIGNELALREPSAPWGPFFLAEVAREKGENERALWMAELALKRGSEIGVLYFLKGQILWTQKDTKNAVLQIERATELDDSNVPAHLFLGQIYFRDQDYSRASKQFFAVLKIEPRHQMALSGLAESQLHENNPQSALDAYARLTENYPHDGQYWSRTAEIYETVMNDPAQALNVYRHIHQLVKNGSIQKNIDSQTDFKIKELEQTVQPKPAKRAVASDDKGRGVR